MQRTERNKTPGPLHHNTGQVTTITEKQDVLACISARKLCVLAAAATQSLVASPALEG